MRLMRKIEPSILFCHLIFGLTVAVLTSCNTYKVNYDKNGEPVLGKNMHFSFDERPSTESLIKLDTSAYYVQIFEGRNYNDEEVSNPIVLVFHNDGYYKRSSLKHYEKDSLRAKDAIWYGGKYRISGKEIELESFAPSKGGKTKQYVRLILKGRIDGDRIILNETKNNALISVFQKRKNLN